MRSDSEATSGVPEAGTQVVAVAGPAIMATVSV